MALLINISIEGNLVRLLHNENGKKSVRQEMYCPYFYLVCRNPDEICNIVSQHPLVLDAQVEMRFAGLKEKSMTPVVKVTTSLTGFRRVVLDVQKVHGITEIAETHIPHYFRYVLDKGVRFFDGQEPLRLAAMSAEEPMPECDVLFTFGGDEFLRKRKGVEANNLGCFLKDCVHIDVKKDMEHDIYGETESADLLEMGKERLLRTIELSGLTGVKPDIISRITPGKLNTFLHMRAARKNGFIIPDTKKSMERPKSLKLLQMMDKGGTIFYPRPGVYRNVAKCDFASMYPSIIVKYNISPETMHCTCNDYIEVPEAHWRICRRKGLIPQGIEEVLRRRLYLKKMKKKTGKKVYDIKQRALKNILVTAFGYLGFKNFVFSNVENKECVMLFGRHILQRTKEIAESMGLEIVYGIVDSVFVKNGTYSEYKEFVEKVSAEFGIELELDCVFKAIAFPSPDGAGIANKYYGVTYDGNIEARGIALRHSDAPAFIKGFQREAVMAFLEGRLEKFWNVCQRYRDAVLEKGFPLEDFAITKAVRKMKYKVDAPHVVAYRQMPIGNHITYVYSRDGPKPLRMAKKEELDCSEYLRILEMKKDELLAGLV